jgi:putative glycosyltransferase
VSNIRLSIVTTLYRSEPFVQEFYRRSVAAAEAFGGPFEVVLVNDGSPDASLDMALALSRSDPRVRLIDLSRNFGHHKAMMTGLAHARGELVFLIDSDLEEDPAWLARFHQTLVAERADVVYGISNRRHGTWWQRLTGWLFYAVFNLMLEHPLPRNVVTARLMTERYVRQLVRHEDRELCIAALWVITGFRQVGIGVDKGRRPNASTYGTRERFAVGVNLLTSFSTRPLLYIFYLGCAIMASATVAAGYLIWRALRHEIGVAGWASVMVSVWFLGGVMIFCLGVIGLYVSKVFMEAKRRPYTVIRAEYPVATEAPHE